MLKYHQLISYNVISLMFETIYIFVTKIDALQYCHMIIY